MLLELQTAIYAGVLASLLFYLKRTSQPRLQRWYEGSDEVLGIEGSIFFGACAYLQRHIQASQAPAVIVDAHYVNFIDYAGVVMLHQEARRLGLQQRSLVLRRVRPRVREELLKLEGAEQCPLQFKD
ncbi:STAS domain protein [compost metagenome]